MDSEILNRLMVQVIYEIQDFLPANLFHPIGYAVKINDRTLSEEQARGVIASGQAEKLFYTPPKNQFMSLKQRDACELLMHMGHLISIDSTDPEQPQVSADFYSSLEKYFFNHLSEQEARPFISLLEDDLSAAADNQRMNENRAFLMKCFDDGVGKNIDSVWLHIKKSAGTDGFLFKTASKDSATTIDGKHVKKKNLWRCLRNLSKPKK